MKTYITSDIHFGHKNILQYCPHRVCPSFDGDVKTATEAEITELVNLMNELIVTNWNSVVTPEDSVYILGDVAMGQIVLAPAVIRQLNGKKMLVAGNHDKTLTKKIRDGDPDFVGLFEWVRDYNEVGYKHSVTGKKHMLIMSHYPMKFWNGSSQNTIHAHGHTHGSPTGISGKILDVGMDTNNMFPYLLEDVIDMLVDKPSSPHH